LLFLSISLFIFVFLFCFLFFFSFFKARSFHSILSSFPISGVLLLLMSSIAQIGDRACPLPNVYVQ
jgi:hypothetical protein